MTVKYLRFRNWRASWFVLYTGETAMHGALNVRLFGKWWCFHPTTRTFGGYWPWYFYVSSDATPCGDAWGFGPGFNK